MQANADMEKSVRKSVYQYLQESSSALDRDDDLDPLIERIGNARYVLLGEASHGTSNFYTWRARITARLIREKNFSLIGVEGDWPDCSAVNHFVKGFSQAQGPVDRVLSAFRRWPTWLWANWEIAALCGLLRRHNRSLAPRERVGFYGLDVYSLWESMNAVLDYLSRNNPQALKAAMDAYRCFEPFGEGEQAYALHTLMVPEDCEEEVVRLLAELRDRAPSSPDDREAAFDAEQNALIMKNAERYYRAMIRGEETWNLRDQHMTDTLERLMEFHGPQAKAIVWAHNTHIGDARGTTMARVGLVSIGQLVRERYRHEGVVLVGSASYRGSVIAGRGWGQPMERMTVPAARPGSWEELFHVSVPGNRLLITEMLPEMPEFIAPRMHRAIGVVYNPEEERVANYVPTVLPRRYDAFVFLDESEALHPLHIAGESGRRPPETFPWGL